jgi:hypothetical protein
MHMYPTIQETGTVGKVQIGQKSVREVLQPQQTHAPVSQQQQQLVQQQQHAIQQIQQQNQQQQQLIQQMRQEMLEMQAEISEYRKPKPKTYTPAQVQVLLAAETINHVVEEFELSTQKRDRLLLARDYLLRLSDLSEWIPESSPVQPPQEEQIPVDEQAATYDQEMGIAVEGDDDQLQSRQYAEDELCEEPTTATPPGVSQKGPEPAPVPASEIFKGKIDPETASELEKIEQRMAELKKEPSEKLVKEKHKTGVEKIKEFFMKKASEDDQKPAPDYSNIPEGMG